MPQRHFAPFGHPAPAFRSGESFLGEEPEGRAASMHRGKPGTLTR